MCSATAVNQLRIVGVSGTNKVMAGEMARLASRALANKLPKPAKSDLGSLVYPFDPDVASLAVHYHRTSTRVLWDLYESTAQRLEPLYADITGLVERDDRAWMADGLGISVDARRVGAFAAGERQVVGTIKNAIIDGASKRNVTLHVDAASPDVLFDVRLREKTLSVSIDLAGRPMYQRGYRAAGGPAPLKENLAAVLVMLARHDARSEPLIDPMAGGGTIAIEAASMGPANPVWLPPRVPASGRLPCMTPVEARPLFGDNRPFVIANEIDRDAFEACRDHVRRAGVGGGVEVLHGDFRALDVQTVAMLCQQHGHETRAGLILSNPPYGQRLAPPALQSLYRDLGRWCRQFDGWRAAFLVSNPSFEESFGGRPRIRKPLSNGPIRSMFLLYDF